MGGDIDWYGPEAATFGDRVAAAREQAGMTQAALAKRLGVRLPTLRAWEDDRSEPRANRPASPAAEDDPGKQPHLCSATKVPLHMMLQLHLCFILDQLSSV